MLLAVDIGNTNISIGIYNGNSIVKSWNVSSNKERTDDEYGVTLLNLVKHEFNQDKIRSAIISSVVPELTDKFRLAIERYLNAPVFVISSKTLIGVVLDVESPEEVGCDRIANACAACTLYGTPAVVIDFGTATNFDVVLPENRFVGGIIAPGLKFSAKSFSSFTNLLPKIKVAEIEHVIGRNTVENMLSGVVIGHAAMIDGLIARIEEELGMPVTTIATGGFSEAVTKHMKRPFDHFNPNLTLEGLRVIYELNKSKTLC